MHRADLGKVFFSIKSTLTRKKKSSIYELDIWYKKYTDKTYGKLDKITIKKLLYINQIHHVDSL